MINKITRETIGNELFDCETIGNELFDSIIDDWADESYSEHRRGSSFYKRLIFMVDNEFFPDNPKLWGLWESNTIITDTEHGWEKSDVNTLYRVEKKTKTIVKEYWERVDD